MIAWTFLQKTGRQGLQTLYFINKTEATVLQSTTGKEITRGLFQRRSNTSMGLIIK